MKFESFPGPNHENKEPLSLSELERVADDMEARSVEAQQAVIEEERTGPDELLGDIDAEALRRTIQEIKSKEQ